MTRLQAAALALAVIAGPTLAHAEGARPAAGEISFQYSQDRLATTAGREGLKVEIAALADGYCRANAVGHTVAGCRADVAKQLSQGVEVRAQAYAKAHPQVQYAQR